MPQSAPLNLAPPALPSLSYLVQQRDGLTRNVKEKTLNELGRIIDARNEVMKRLMLGGGNN